jgi:hypothetical protein
MIDLYLKATTMQALHTALVVAKLATAEPEFATIEGVSLDEIGAIEGQAGYFANLRLEGELPEGATLPVIDEPETPVRVWFDLPADPIEPT